MVWREGSPLLADCRWAAFWSMRAEPSFAVKLRFARARAYFGHALSLRLAARHRLLVCPLGPRCAGAGTAITPGSVADHRAGRRRPGRGARWQAIRAHLRRAWIWRLRRLQCVRRPGAGARGPIL